MSVWNLEISDEEADEAYSDWVDRDADDSVFDDEIEEEW